jgi:hypothetical protein
MDPRREYGEHGEWDALAVGWALSALDHDDEELFAAHLPGCDRCTATVRESLYTVADLAYALPDEAPPASMKTRLMAAVAAEPRTARSPAPAAEEEWPLGEPHPGTPGYNRDWFARNQPAAKDEPYPATDRGLRPEQPVVPAPERPVPPELSAPPEPSGPEEPAPAPPESGEADSGGRHAAPRSPVDDGVVVPMAPYRRRFVATVAAAAAVVLIAVLGVWNLQLRSDQRDLKQIVAQREAAIQQLTANGPARVAALTADGKPSATRKATLVVRGNQVEIIIETLGATTANETYWLWTLRCDTVKPTDLKPIQGFTVAQPDFSVRDIGSEPGAATATCFALSSEQGTATPKTPRLVIAVGKPT